MQAPSSVSLTDPAMSMPMMAHPSRAIAKAEARPMPRAAPVTIATLCFSLPYPEAMIPLPFCRRFAGA